MILPRRFLAVLGLIAASACSLRNVSCGGAGSQQAAGTAVAAPEAQAAPEGAPAAAAGGSGRLAIAFLGDSVTAGLGLTTAQAYPSRIEEMFEAEGYREVEVVNAGISGDTTAGGLRRVDQALEPGVRILVVALGGNDALRGLSPTQTRENLQGIIEQANAKGVGVVLVGMLAPPNYGTDYQDAFRGVFVSLARQFRDSIVFIPFLLEGVAGDPALNQADGIHPNEQGMRVIAEKMYPQLRKLVDAMPAPGVGGGHD